MFIIPVVAVSPPFGNGATSIAHKPYISPSLSLSSALPLHAHLPHSSSMASVEQVVGIASLLTLASSALHFRVARIFRGNRKGSTINIRVILFTYFTAVLVILCALALLTLFFYRLIVKPNDASLSEQLVIVVIAASSLVYSGICGCDRRRRIVAVKLASIPCFGNGNHASNHQLLAVEKSPMLCFAPQFIAAEHPAVSVTTETTDSHSAQSYSESPDRKKSSTVGITKRKVWELSCRSANTWVWGRPKRQAWVS